LGKPFRKDRNLSQRKAQELNDNMKTIPIECWHQKVGGNIKVIVGMSATSVGVREAPVL